MKEKGNENFGIFILSCSCNTRNKEMGKDSIRLDLGIT